MLEFANGMSGLDLSITFQTCLLLSLLLLSPKKLAELLKDMGHAQPRARADYNTLQRAILRERALEGPALDLRQGALDALGSTSPSYLTVDYVRELRPLHLCLGDPCGNGMTCDASIHLGSGGKDDVVNVYDGHCSIDGDGDSDVPSDEERWALEGEHDPISCRRVDWIAQ